MSEHKQSLSALMDGEVNELELRRLLKHADRDPALAQQWQRYQLSAALLKKEPASLAGNELSSRVMAAIADDTAGALAQDKQGVSGGFSGMYRSLASMAVAASVTAVVILGPGWLAGDAQTLQTQPVTAAATQNVPRNSLAQPVTFGSRPVAPSYQGSMLANDAEMIRSPAGMQRYIDQHLSLMDERPPQWELGWLPEGYQNIRHQVTQAGEVMVFSNGRKAFSVSVERLGQQTVPEGVTDAGDFIALGLHIDDRFVTVVGDMPIMVAERIASSVVSGR
ncbi:MucB/RseB C-terminal domain-containing protein [Nitrincola sp. A-D6]|uniref:MucB/RseB C-terminal domain-containing protein n=1 Tax=Nitrincola sp. A-D6 TaxID=1545442 RepID=UPI0006899E88|nr:MucB/RseB C-terminal domain-containing protein [Nitrincola sp. A-D6]